MDHSKLRPKVAWPQHFFHICLDTDVHRDEQSSLRALEDFKHAQPIVLDAAGDRSWALDQELKLVAIGANGPGRTAYSRERPPSQLGWTLIPVDQGPRIQGSARK
jgi:hypothetical protein